MNSAVIRCLLISAALHGAALTYWQWPSPPALPAATAPFTLVFAAAPPAASAGTAAAPASALPTRPAASAAPPTPVASPAAKQALAPAAGPALDETATALALPAADASLSSTAPVPPAPDRASAPLPALSADAEAEAQTAAMPPGDDDGNASNPAVVARRLDARVRGALAAHFVYPALARRQGWEGEVKVGVRVNADGRLSDIHLVASSGYDVLDRAALRTLAEVRRLDDGGRWLSGSHFDMVLPIQYHLIDG